MAPQGADTESKGQAAPSSTDWQLEDPRHPRNWPFAQKCVITCITSIMTFTSTFASSVFSAAETATAAEFNVSHEVMVLGLSLFVLGYCLGPLLWGPLSESHGRKQPLMAGVLVFCIFQIPVALAKNVETILVCRFIGGIFSCTPLSIVGAILVDIWNPVSRGIAACVYSTATFSGPVVGPIVGNVLVTSRLGWRWTAWVTMIFGGGFWVLGMLFVPETHVPTLRRRAQSKTMEGSSPVHRIDLNEFATKFLTRPIIMIATEPMLALTTLYMAFVYGIMYLFFEAYPISFREDRGWAPRTASLPFLAMTVGVVIGNLIVAATTLLRWKPKYLKDGNKMIPEERLIPMMIGAIILPIGLFWFAWTSNPHITWVPQVVAGAPIGLGIQIIYTMGFNYILDVYSTHSASAASINTMARSTAGAAFPLFATPMYHRLGVSWATSLLAFLSIGLAPVPFIFYKYGKQLRGMGEYSVK